MTQMIYEDALCHYGVLGMKWGRRRYQNKDGNLTPAGRAHYGSEKSSTDSVKTETTEEKKERILKSRSAKELYKNADLFSDQELQRAYNRLALERNIASLSPKEVSKGQKFVDRVVSTGKTINDLTELGTRTYNNVARLHNTFTSSGRENPLPIVNSGGNDKKKK